MRGPAGTRTFVFTDIGQSSSLWESDPTSMSSVVERHNEIVRGVVQRHQGEVFKSLGDGLGVVFHEPHCAVLAAIEAQSALIEGLPSLGVRIGIHMGHAELIDDDYQGTVVNRVARVTSLARPGQILVTRTVRDLTADVLGQTVEWRDLGEGVLRGHERKEHLWEVQLPGALSATPMGRLFAQSHNLTGLDRPFVGRGRERSQLLQWLATDRVRHVTILGFGGIGKTSLANVVAWDCLPYFDDGVFWVECDIVRTREQLAAGIALALNEPVSDPDAERGLVTAIGDQSMLIVADCCEGLVEHAPFFERILRACPRLQVLATSRVVLGTAQERQLDLRSLAGTAEAVKLFADAALLSVPGFELRGDSRRSVGRIVERLERVPLALVLVAGRLRHMSLEEIEGRLDDSVLRTASSPTPRGKHGALRTVIDGSFELLSPQERQTLEQLAVFQGGFFLDAAEHVTGLKEETVDALARLRDSSLLMADVRGTRMRYRALDSVKEYCLETADNDVLAASRCAHAAHYNGVARTVGRQLWSGEAEAAQATLALEIGNFRAAVTTAIEYGDQDLVASLAGSLCRALHESGYGSDFHHLCTAGLRVAQETGDTSLQLDLMGLSGIAARRAGQTRQAAQIWTERAGAARAAEDWDTTADSLGDLLDLYTELGDNSAAENLVKDLKALEARNLSPERQAELKIVLARHELLAGRPEPACDLAREAEKIGVSGEGRYYLLRSLAEILREAGHWDESLHKGHQYLRLALDSRHLYRIGHALTELTESYGQSGNNERVSKCLTALAAMPRRVSSTVVARTANLAEKFDVDLAGLATQPPQVNAFVELAHDVAASQQGSTSEEFP